MSMESRSWTIPPSPLSSLQKGLKRLHLKTVIEGKIFIVFIFETQLCSCAIFYPEERAWRDSWKNRNKPWINNTYNKPGIPICHQKGSSTSAKFNSKKKNKKNYTCIFWINFSVSSSGWAQSSKGPSTFRLLRIFIGWCHLQWWKYSINCLEQLN